VPIYNFVYQVCKLANTNFVPYEKLVKSKAFISLYICWCDNPAAATYSCIVVNDIEVTHLYKGMDSLLGRKPYELCNVDGSR
jgi:hypothetical protein